MTTISVPAEATRFDETTPSQTPTTLRSPEIGPSPPPLPLPGFLFENTPSPPTSPTPQSLNGLTPTRRQLINPDPPRMAVDDPLPQPPMEPNAAQPREEDPEPNRPQVEMPRAPQPAPQFAPFTSFATANNDLAIPLPTPRNAPRDPLDKFTRATMPKVHDAHPTAALDLVDREALDEWDNLTPGKLIAIPFDNVLARYPHKQSDISGGILAAAADITQSQELGIAVPKPNDKAKRSKHTPTTFLIYNLNAAQYETLLRQKVWSSIDITFRVTPPAPSIPDFLFSITGLTTMDTNFVRNIVKNVWLDDQSQDFFQRLHQAMRIGEIDNFLESVQNFLNSVEVKRLDIKEAGNILSPRFNILTDSRHITDHQTWTQIRHYLANRTYDTPVQGQGTTTTAEFDCGICHGVDHPRGLCPFPAIPGWNGPPWRPLQLERSESRRGRPQRAMGRR
jgi:hypothetical protein